MAFAIRTFRFGAGSHVIAARGELDAAAAADVAAEVTRRCGEGTVVVDLLHVVVAHDDAIDRLRPAVRGETVTVVADERLCDRIGLVGEIRLKTSLAAALP